MPLINLWARVFQRCPNQLWGGKTGITRTARHRPEATCA
jgi:hypothetical protein